MKALSLDSPLHWKRIDIPGPQNPGPGAASGNIYIGNINHTPYLRMGTCWTAGCHTAIHGSNVDPKFRY